MDGISTFLTQLLFALVLLALPVSWLLGRRRERRLSRHYAKLKFKPLAIDQLQPQFGADRFALLEKKWFGSGKTSELHVGDFESLMMAQFTLSHVDGAQGSHVQTVTLIKGAVSLPHFVLRPENVADKFRDRFKQVDIDFDSHPRFSSSYQLEAADESAVRAFFGKALLDYFEDNSGFSLESVGSDVLIFRDYKRVSSAADIDVQLRLAHTLYRRLLEHGRH